MIQKRMTRILATGGAAAAVLALMVSGAGAASAATTSTSTSHVVASQVKAAAVSAAATQSTSGHAASAAVLPAAPPPLGSCYAGRDGWKWYDLDSGIVYECGRNVLGEYMWIPIGVYVGSCPTAITTPTAAIKPNEVICSG